VFGATGYAAVSVKQVCQAAGLTERYFYQSFSDREALLAGVYDWQVDQLKQATLTALVTAEPTIESQAIAGISAFARFVAPRSNSADAA
jgi:AcrR family transcriptional regulator